MSYYSDISKLTLDQGARALAQIMDELQEQVNNCCGGSVKAAGNATPAASPEPAPARVAPAAPAESKRKR